MAISSESPIRIDMGPLELLEIAKKLAHDAQKWPGTRDPTRRVWELIDASRYFEAWVMLAPRRSH